MNDFALWRRLDTPGHDAAQMARTDTGWRLQGTAVFRHENGSAMLGYALDLDDEWNTVRGLIRGFLAERTIDQRVLRDKGGWTINGKEVEGLAHLVDLDLGFTPATNLQQLRRARLRPGEAADISVAWLDAGADTLVELHQRYERLDERSYRYEAPRFDYQAVLRMAENGFVALYPDLWEMER